MLPSRIWIGATWQVLRTPAAYPCCSRHAAAALAYRSDSGGVARSVRSALPAAKIELRRNQSPETLRMKANRPDQSPVAMRIKEEYSLYWRRGGAGVITVRQFSTGLGEEEVEGHDGGRKKLDTLELLRAIQGAQSVKELLRHDRNFTELHLGASWRVFARVAGERPAHQLAEDHGGGLEQKVGREPLRNDPEARELLWKHKQLTLAMLEEDILSVRVLVGVIEALAELVLNHATTMQEVHQAFVAIAIRCYEKVQSPTTAGALAKDLTWADVARLFVALVRYYISMRRRGRRGDDDDQRGGNRPVGAQFSWRNLGSDSTPNPSVMSEKH